MAQRGLGAFDLVLEGDGIRIGFNLAQEAGRPAVEPFELGPGRTDEVVRNADVPRVIDSLDAGMGYSRRLEKVPNGYDYCAPGYTRSPGAVFMPAGKLRTVTMPTDWLISQFSCSARFDGVIFVGAGRTICQLSADGSSATTVFTGGVDFYANEMAVFNNRLYCAGRNGGLARRDPGGGWSTVATGVPSWGLATANWRPQGVPTEVMATIWFENNWSSLKWCPITADPMNPASWSASVTIGSDRRYQMGPIVAAPRHMYVYGRDGIYDVDELGARSFNLAPWLAENQDTRNGLWGMHVGTGAYYSHSAGLAFVETSGDTQYRPEWVQPGWGLPYEGQVQGMPIAGTLHGGWGLVGFFMPSVYPPIAGVTPSLPSVTWICAGRRVSEPPAGGGPTHVWHGAEAVVPGAVTHMRVYTNDSADGWPELLLLAHGGDIALPVDRGQTYWQSLSKVGNPLQELIWGGKFQPADLSTLYLPADPWDRPSAVKQLLQVDLLSERLNLGSDYLKVYAATDGAAFVEQGTADEYRYTALQPSPVLEGRYLSTKVEATGHPVLRSLELRAAMGIQLRAARTYRVILAWDNALRGATRGRETADPEKRAYELQHLLGRICLLEDATTREPVRVRVLQIHAGERRRIGGAPRAGSNGAEGAWAITAAITVSFLDPPGFRWDGTSVDRYDRDRIWT